MKILRYALILNVSIIFFSPKAQASHNNLAKPYCHSYCNILNDSLILDYTFKNPHGQPVKLSDFRGKFILIDLWYSGCGFCISANRALRIVHEDLKDKNIVFLSISIDTNIAEWKASIKEGAKPTKLYPWAGKYVPANGAIALYTGGTGANNDFVRKYIPNNSYPKLMLIAPTGKLISSHPPRPDAFPVDQPQKLTDFITHYLNRLQ